MTIRAAIIGCGKRSAFFSRACQRVGGIKMVGYADPVDGLATLRAEEYGGVGYTDVAAMLQQTQPDFVMLITRPSVRLDPIRLCGEAGIKLMLAEKPMSTSWAEARALHQIAADTGMYLNFCHQRRCEAWYLQARHLIASGAIGKLTHLVAHCDNLYDWGTHWFDMMHHFNGEADAEWLIAQADRTNPNYIFDQPMDRCGVSVVGFANGVIGTLQTGQAQAEHARIRAIGEGGTLVVSDGGKLEWFDRDGEHVGKFGDDALPGLPAALAHVIDSYKTHQPSMLDSANALRATQLIFASYQSAMTGGKVDLPLPDDCDLSLTDVFAAA